MLMRKRDSKGRFAYSPDGVVMKGYPVIYAPQHPRAKANGYVREHILVVEKMLGRPLKDGEVVHHINEDKKDNRPENLMVFASHSEHMRYHWGLRHSVRSDAQ